MNFPLILLVWSALLAPIYFYNLFALRRLPGRMKWDTPESSGPALFKLEAVLYGISIAANILGSATVLIERNLVSKGEREAAIVESFLKANWKYVTVLPFAICLLFTAYLFECALLALVSRLARAFRRADDGSEEDN